MTDARQPTNAPIPDRRRRRRNPGLLLALAPPMTILVCAGVVLAYRLWRTDWPGFRLFQTPAATARPAAPSSPAPSPLASTKVVARVKADPIPEPLIPFSDPVEPAASASASASAPASASASAAAPEPEPEPVEVATTRPLPAPEPLEPFIQPMPPEPISKAEALAGIAREAAQLRAERHFEDGLKAQAAAREQAETRRRQAEQARRALHFVEDDRALFRQDLTHLLAGGGAQPAKEIEALCRRRKASMPPEVRRAFEQARVSVSAKLDRRERVEFYRRRGIPEETILYELANMELANVGLRHGPRNRDAALVRGARRLLEVPLPTPSPAAVADAAAHPGQAPAARP